MFAIKGQTDKTTLLQVIQKSCFLTKISLRHKNMRQLNTTYEEETTESIPRECRQL